MALVRRGGLGILMFAAALALMPVLVLWHHHHPDQPARDATLTVAGSGQTGGAMAATRTNSDASTPPVIPASPVRPAAVPSRSGAVGTGAVGTGAGSAASPALIGFTGIVSGNVVSGFMQGVVVSGVVEIELVVSGSPGTILFSLTGSVPTSYTATGPPFLFAPQETGWNTTRFPSGQYTLTATASQRSVPPLAVTFQVANPLPPRSAAG